MRRKERENSLSFNFLLGLGPRPQRPRELQLGQLARPPGLLRHGRLLLRQRQLHVARARHVRADAAVRAVGAAALLDCLVHLDVRDVERVDVEAFHLGVGLCVAKQADQQLHRLGGPAPLAVVGRRLVLGLRRAADPAAEAAEGDDALLAEHRLKVGLGLGELHLAEGEGGLAGVLEVDAEVAVVLFLFCFVCCCLGGRGESGERKGEEASVECFFFRRWRSKRKSKFRSRHRRLRAR